MAYWLIKAEFHGLDAPEDLAGVWPPDSRASILNASVIRRTDVVKFMPVAAVEADLPQEAISEALAVLRFVARQYGSNHLVNINAAEYDTTEALRKALES